ncbi:MAG: flagellar hook-associated protein FlgK [Caulobacteraceae bacterium]
MSGDLTLALRTAQSGLLANQAALGAVANNVSNVNTEGYSRQVVNLEHRVVAGKSAGVQLAALSRRIDEGLMKSFRTEAGALNAISVQQTFFQRTQQLFGSPGDNTSLSHTLGNLAQALQSLAATPEGALEQREMVRRADEVAVQFRHMSGAIQDLRLEADQRIGQAVSEINGLLDQVAGLNDKIVRNGAIGHSTTDLEDQRDRALDRLSQLIDTQVFQRGNGDVVVFSGGGRVLVDGVARPLTHIPAAATSATMTHANGGLSGIYSGDALPANDMTTQIRSGELKGLIEMRDGILPNLQSSLNALAGQVHDTVNEIHNRGVAFPGLQEMTGSRAFSDPTTQTLSISGDVAIVLFDGNGKEVAKTHLSQLVSPLDAPLANVATALNDWLQTNGGDASFVPSGGGKHHLAINVVNSGHYLAFRDEAGGGATDPALPGFSSFFGLNDFFVSNQDNALAASTLAVRGDIKAQPSLVARGTVQAKGIGAGTEYFASIGDDSTIHQMATAFSASRPFVKAGSLGAMSASFSQYAAEIISENASRAEANDAAAGFQGTLVDSLKAKSDSVRGVNLDEEMSELILYEQAYAAAARLIGVIQNMFEALDRAVL